MKINITKADFLKSIKASYNIGYTDGEYKERKKDAKKISHWLSDDGVFELDDASENPPYDICRGDNIEVFKKLYHYAVIDFNNNCNENNLVQMRCIKEILQIYLSDDDIRTLKDSVKSIDSGVTSKSITTVR